MARLTPEIESASPHDVATLRVTLADKALDLTAIQVESQVFFTFASVAHRERVVTLLRLLRANGATREWYDPITDEVLRVYTAEDDRSDIGVVTQTCSSTKDDPSIIVDKGLYVHIFGFNSSLKLGHVQSLATIRPHKD